MTSEIREVIEAVHYRPAVSIIMPFETRINLQTELTHSLKAAADKTEKELLKNYPDEISRVVMSKLRALISDLDINTSKKSIVIYVSPVFKKVIYLDVAVEEKIIIDESFEIRDLVYSKKQISKYLLLLLSSKKCRLYLADSHTMIALVSGIPDSAYTYVNDIAERVANFSDMSERKQIIRNKFLHHIDTALDDVLHEYQAPLFVLGTEKILGHFKKFTKHKGSVIGYLQGNYDDSSFSELREILEPYIADRERTMQTDLLNRLEEAAGKKKLAIGMKEVWRQAMNRKGYLLVVEKDYMYAAEHGSTEEIIDETVEPYNKFSCIKDAVDDVIEKVLQNGGDVEFADIDALKDYQHIALIQYY